MIELNINKLGNLEICIKEHEDVVTIYEWCLKRFIDKISMVVDPDIIQCKVIICETYQINKYASVMSNAPQVIEIVDLEDDDCLVVSDEECKEIIDFVKGLSKY